LLSFPSLFSSEPSFFFVSSFVPPFSSPPSFAFFPLSRSPAHSAGLLFFGACWNVYSAHWSQCCRLISQS
jgi:hypothetical protein